MLNMNKSRVCVHKEHTDIWIPLLVVIAAVLFMFNAQGFLDDYVMQNTWPLLLGLGGVVKLWQYSCTCDEDCDCECKQ